MLLDYRKDIDGLRAVAVMLVVLFHAGLPIGGGFVGVDVFFVISGFLITSLIQKQILRDKFTFKGFYLHRMRRILPAFLAVVITVLIVNWLLVMPYHFIFFARSLLYSLVSASNIFFNKSLGDYFSADTEQIQLLHTWSLSVEEQFYIIIPIFLILLFKFFYKTKWFNIILIVLLIISFGMSQYLAIENKIFAYYMLPARFFEMFIGVVLALNYQKLPVMNRRIFNEMLALIAILLILIPAFMISQNSVFPGFNAFYVCLGTSIIIYLGKVEKTTFVNKILSTKPFVFIGLISYSLYLWHWPLFSTINMLGVKLNLVSSIAVIFIIMFISYLSWKFIEQPFRYKFKWKFSRTFITLFLIPVCLGGILKSTSKDYKGFVDIRFSEEVQKLVKSSMTRSFRRPEFCHNFLSLKDKKLEDCVVGDKSNVKIKALIAGDSHASALLGFADIILKDANIKSSIITNNSIMFLKGETDVDKSDGIKIVDDLIESQVKSQKYDYVILTGFYNKYLEKYGKDNFEKWFEESIKIILANDAIPVIIDDIVALDSTPTCPYFNKRFGLNNNCNIPYSEYKKQSDYMSKLLDKLKLKYPKMIRVNLPKAICSADGCKVSLNDVSIYYDDDHMSYMGGEEIAKQYLKRFGNPFIDN